jgi:hypothetical protein
MWRQAPSSSTPQAEWQTVSREEPCAICAGESGCSVDSDGEFARCLTTPSEWPIVSGGWLHRVLVKTEHALLI